MSVGWREMLKGTRERKADEEIPEEEEGRDGVRQTGGWIGQGKEECPLF